MKKIINHMLKALLFSIAFTMPIHASEEASLITCQNKENSGLKVLLVLMDQNNTLKNVAKIAAFDFAFTDQLVPEIKYLTSKITKEHLKKFFKEDYSLCVCLKTLSQKKDKDIISVYIKDTESGNTIFEKSFFCSPTSLIRDSHNIAAEVIPKLTGNSSVALSSLAYCEQYKMGAKSICISDYACFAKTTILKDNALNIAPAWHSDNHHLFYSRFTKRYSQLRCFDFTTKTNKALCSYDGINMQPSCSQDGKQVVLSMSGKRGNTELYLYDQRICKAAGKRVFKQITHNGGCNVSPCLLPDGNLIFCSDFETGSPQIYHLNMKTLDAKRITNKHGYCAGPSYNATNKHVVYSRLLDGAFQLFTVDLNENQLKERQLTDSMGDKLDPSWSPCGRYIAFTYDYVDAITKKRVPQVAVLNYHSGIIRILTKDAVPKSFVTWTDKSHYSC